MYCKFCLDWNCKKHTMLFTKAKPIKEFSGSSPPEVFVGKWNYPNVYVGILSPPTLGDTELLSSHELWHKNKLKIPQILDLRNQLIYSRTQNNIKQVLNTSSKFLPVMQEVAMTSKSISAEYKLKKPVTQNKERESRIPIISNAAQIESAKLTENTKIEPKVDYLVNDTDSKSITSILELEKSKIPNSTIIKLLSSGLLGLKSNRKLVPTRWSITAVDDTLSKHKLKKVKDFPVISEFQVFNAEYLGNHYEFLLLPEPFSFEVIEISTKSGVWKDYESFHGRKGYADSVTGAYYANRLALTEYLEKIKRQASCLVMRQITEEYYAPLGVGILRETSREAFTKNPEKFNTLDESFQSIKSRLKIPLTSYISSSNIINSFGKQTRLFDFIK